MKKLRILVMICAILLTGCYGQERIEAPKEEKVEIGFSFDSFVIERWHREQEIFVATAEELGAEVYVQNANGNLEKQIEQIEYLIEKEVDALVVVPVDSVGIAPVVRKAISQGIKVVSYDRLIQEANVDLCVSFNNERVGEMLTEGLLQPLNDDANILVIMGSPKDSNVIQVDEAFERLIKEKKVNVLEKVYADNWRAEVAFNQVVKHLESGDEIDGIFCGNDDLAQNAIKALSEYRKAGNVCVVGQDADLLACQRIIEGTQNMTVFKDVMTLAKKTAEMTMQLIKGEKIETTGTIDDGRYEVPYYCIEPVKVTKDNIDKVIIASGFHLREEVYLNVSQKEEEK